MASTNAADIPATARLRQALTPRAATGATVTYQQLARELELRAPASIHRLTLALEALMTEDAEAGRPQIAALVVSRTRDGLPAPGFFAHLRALGLHDGPEQGAAAAACHRRLLAEVANHYAAGD